MILDHQSSERLVNMGADLARAEANIKKLEASNKALATKLKFAGERILGLEHEADDERARRIEQRSVELAVIQELTKRLESTPDTLSEANEHLRKDIEIVVKARDMARRDLEQAKRELVELKKANVGLVEKIAESHGEVEQLRAINEAFDVTNAELIEALGEARRDEHGLRSELHAKDLQIARLESELSGLLAEKYKGHGPPQESGLAIGDTAAVRDPRVFTGLTTQQAREHKAMGALITCPDILGSVAMTMQRDDEHYRRHGYEPFTATYPTDHEVEASSAIAQRAGRA